MNVEVHHGRKIGNTAVCIILLRCSTTFLLSLILWFRIALPLFFDFPCLLFANAKSQRMNLYGSDSILKGPVRRNDVPGYGAEVIHP